MTSPIVVKSATQADEKALVRLLRQAARLYPDELALTAQDLLTHRLALAAWEGEELRGCLALSHVRPSTARIEAIALRHRQDTDCCLERLLSCAEDDLREQGIGAMVYVAEDLWPASALRRQGFDELSTILRLRKAGWAVPDTGNDRVCVRSARAQDVPALVRLDEAAFQEDIWRNDGDAFLRYLEQMPHFIVAEQGEQLVGYQVSQVRDREGYLARVAVHPDAQGQRIGVRLVAEAIQFLRARGAYHITLNTQSDNYTARRLYEWFGFRPVGQEMVVLQRRVAAPRNS